MSALADRLRERIRREGPIIFYDWMKAALYDPENGYYCRSDRERWGREGDYRTSPERSVLFGATFARYFARLFEDLGSPRAWSIVEAGAGAGHFAENVLATLQQRFPKVFSATRYVIDEPGSASRSRAKDRLARFGAKVEFKHLEELEPLNPAIVFANELLDALPVHRVAMQGDVVREFYVGVNESGGFQWMIGAPSKRLEEDFVQLGIELRDGQTVEVNPGIQQWLELISRKIMKGYVISVDYGAEAHDLYAAAERPEGTLRAFHRHEFAPDVLARPGEQDITSSINWTIVKTFLTKSGFEIVEFERQDKFLLSAGLLEEMEFRLKETRSEAEKLHVRACAREMILPGGMAESFQVLVAKKIDRRLG